MNFKLSFSILVLFLLLIIIHLSIYTQNISLKYQLTDLKVKLTEQNSQTRQLGAQVSNKENLAYIEKVAKEKLNMVFPEKIYYITAKNPNRLDWLLNSREADQAPTTLPLPDQSLAKDLPRGNKSGGVRR